MNLKLEGTFELLTKEEWDKYLETDIFNKMKFDFKAFEKQEEDIMLYPLLEELIKSENNKIGSIQITYAICRHYYDKGIPS